MRTVAIQGISGSYSEEAARMLVSGSRIIECEDFYETFSSVNLGVADCAVVPLRNKIVGEIISATEPLFRSRLKISESIVLKVRHVLTALPGAKLNSIDRVFSHPEAIKQCSRFFVNNPGFEAVGCSDTASAIRDVIRSGQVRHAAICSERAARLFGAEILRRNIADDPNNLTSFYLVSK